MGDVLTCLSAYFLSDTLSIVIFWELISHQTSSHLGSSYGALIGKRLVATMNPESEVGFALSHLKPPV